jgi:GWxTD domain-containing protein
VPLPSLEQGFYQCSVNLISWPDTSDTSKVYSLDAAVFGPGFPRPQTIDDLVGPLTYVADRTLMDSLRVVRSPATRKRLFDHFWLSEADNENAAGNAIKQYYTRVEEANRYFTTFKEGWRTDRGMLYIVLGPPSSVTHVLDKEVWYYSSNSDDVYNSYTFYRTPGSEKNPLLQNYILDRHPYYESGWEQAVDRWRRASVF